MTAGKGPLRFRRTSYKGKNSKGETESRWHRSARPIRDRHEYKQLTALCGYTVPPSIALFLGYDISKARIPRHGELCSKCEKVAKDEEEYAARYAEKHPKDHIKKEET